MQSHQHHSFSSHLNTSELQRHAISMRHFVVLLSWSIFIMLVCLIMGWNFTWLIVISPLYMIISYIMMWVSVSTTGGVSPYKSDVSVGEDGLLSVRWGMVTHRWGRKQWYEGIRKNERVIIVRWPWCLFATYTVFPVPRTVAEQGASSDR
ncbi:hypothetical protein NT6N_04140 [Oceaniferula spumae]|uniref:DUF304 domain-containing protein n=1 Tax=Oceaniferula spumae TaxID=2979115 RepID=A0AAT9FH88_9BACT